MTHNRENEERQTIQKADPAARSRAIWIAVFGVLLAGLLVLLVNLFEAQFTEWGRDISAGVINHPEMLSVVLFVMMLPLLASAVYVFIQGGRVVKSQRMPYPGQTVIKDTPIIEGKPAVKHGRALQAVAVVMMVLSLAVPFLPPLFMLFLSRGT
ncbi:MAG: hypothetical protein R3212_14100 [Xanthomonadales bacterium]|nr:hypothetical protein [Xanthomonadales bacterium]